MAAKAIVVDQDNVQHLIIGLNRENIDSLCGANVLPFQADRSPLF